MLRARRVRNYVAYGWRRARDRNSGARTNRALQLSASSDINAASRTEPSRTGRRRRRRRKPPSEQTRHTLIFSHIHAAEVKRLPGEKIVLARPRETEGNVRLGARVRPGLCSAPISAVFNGIITLHLSLTVMFKATFMLRRVKKKKTIFLA